MSDTTNPFSGQTRVGDFFAPFFTVRFVAADAQQGTVVDEDTGAEEITEIQESGFIVVSQGDTQIMFTEDERTSQFRSYATKLAITNKGGGCCMAELTLEPPFEDAIAIADNKLIQVNSLMVIEWGYSSESKQEKIISEKHVFVVLPPKMEMRGTEITFTLTGIDMFSYSSTKRETRTVFRRTKASPDGTTYSTDLMILEAIAKKNKMRLNLSLAPADAVVRQQKPVDKQDAEAIEQNEKDYQFFKRICEMNRCDFFAIGDTIFVVDQNVARVQQLAYRMVFWNQPREANDIPIYTFSTQALATLFIPAESKEVVRKSADEDLGTVETQRIDPQTQSTIEAVGPRGIGGKSEADGRTIRVSDDVQVIPNPKFSSNETGKMMSCPSGQANKQEFTERVVRDANSLANTNAEVSCPGVPGLVPMQLVRVEGVGLVFSGTYLVLQVVHNLSTDGYDCAVTLIRESSTGDPVAGRGQRPITGGNDPDQADPGDGVEPKTADES